MRAAIVLAALAVAACTSPTVATYPDIVRASLNKCAYIPAPDSAKAIIAKSNGKGSATIAGDICEVVEGKGPANVAGVPLQGFRVR